MRTATIVFQVQRPNDHSYLKWVKVTGDGPNRNQAPEPEHLHALIDTLRRHATTCATDD